MSNMVYEYEDMVWYGGEVIFICNWWSHRTVNDDVYHNDAADNDIDKSNINTNWMNAK